jgi:hypothetical protein
MELYEEFNKFVVKEPSELDNLDLKKCYARLVISKIMVTISSFFICLLHRIIIQLFRHRPLDHYPFLLLLSNFDQSYFHLSFSPHLTLGFSCELVRSYFAGHDKISHQNVILDSIIGENVWFGGYSGTINVQPNRKNIKYKIDDVLIDTGADCFGAVVGNDCTVGASVTILPGTQILPTSLVQA